MFCRGNVDEKHDKWFIEAENFVKVIDMDIDVKKPRYASQQKISTQLLNHYRI